LRELRNVKQLQHIESPDDLKKLTIEQLQEVCDDLREFIIEQLSCNPGHFGSSLGTVELTVALHYLYNTPYDRLVWDVGHQAYGHKILTGPARALPYQPEAGRPLRLYQPRRERVRQLHRGARLHLHLRGAGHGGIGLPEKREENGASWPSSAMGHDGWTGVRGAQQRLRPTQQPPYHTERQQHIH